MRKISLLVLMAGITLASCQPGFKKGEKGLEYKIISDGKGQKLSFGKFMQIQIAQYYSAGHKDTLLSDSRTGMPMIEVLDSVMTPPEYYKILTQVRKGDSLVIRVSTDTLFKRMQGGLPPFMKKGNYLLTTVKLVNIFDNRNQADSARAAEMEIAKVREEKRSAEQLKKDDKELQDYFKKNNIQTIKAPEGTYVQILQPGTGSNLDTTNVAYVNYTGKLLNGKAFDSNTDPSFGHVEPFSVNLTNDRSLGNSVIKGWNDGLTMLNKGAKAVFYIPSSLAYGDRGAGEKIGPNAILMFEIEVTDVLGKVAAKAKMEAERNKMMAEQKKINDSITNASKNAKPGK